MTSNIPIDLASLLLAGAPARAGNRGAPGRMLSTFLANAWLAEIG